MVKFEAGQRLAPPMPVGPVFPPAAVDVAGTFAALVLAGPALGMEEDCPPIGGAGVLEVAEPGIEQ